MTEVDLMGEINRGAELSPGFTWWGCFMERTGTSYILCSAYHIIQLLLWQYVLWGYTNHLVLHTCLWFCTNWVPQLSESALLIGRSLSGDFTWSRASCSSADCCVPARISSLLESCRFRSFTYTPILIMSSTVSILQGTGEEKEKCIRRECKWIHMVSIRNPACKIRCDFGEKEIKCVNTYIQK